MFGEIRVGRRIYEKNGKFTDPSFPNFKSILCLTKSSEYGSLGPYVLANSKGHIMENIWQFSKIYEHVSHSKQAYSRYDKTTIWEYPEHNQLFNGSITEDYEIWRSKGMNNKYPVRYPVGFHDKNKCIGSIKSNEFKKWKADKNYKPKMLSYIEARKEIYLKTYLQLVKTCPDFDKLYDVLKTGTNLLIIEVDGPHQDHLEYYKTKYGVKDDFIENNTILATKENMDIMLNDDKFSFGHGYCLAIALNNYV